MGDDDFVAVGLKAPILYKIWRVNDDIICE